MLRTAPTSARGDPNSIGRCMALDLVRTAGLLGFVTLAYAGMQQVAQASEYLLGSQDRLRIKLVEWRPGNGEAVDWESLSDEYTVGAAGRIAIPMLGEFKAGGKTPTALSVEVATQLQKRVGLPARPEVSVEVLSYRPFYVLGSVDKPGEYAFRPDVTALQAVGIASGLYRPADPGLLRLERDRITAFGALEESRATLGKALVREARLLSELNGRLDFTMPSEVDGKGFDARIIATLMSDEASIAKARATAYEAQIKSGENLKVLLDNQIKTLTAKIMAQDKQIDISRRELASYSTLTSQGLAVSSRQFALERAVTDDESKRLDYEMAQLNARQDRQKAEQSQIDATNDRRSKILDELSEVRGGIAESRAKVRAGEDLVNEATAVAPRAFLDRERALRDQKPIFILTRRNADGAASVTVVEDTTLLEPGDVLRVEVPGVLGPSGSERSVRKEAEVQ